MSRATERISPLQTTWTATIQGDRIRIILPSPYPGANVTRNREHRLDRAPSPFLRELLWPRGRSGSTCTLLHSAPGHRRGFLFAPERPYSARSCCRHWRRRRLTRRCRQYHRALARGSLRFLGTALAARLFTGWTYLGNPPSPRSRPGLFSAPVTRARGAVERQPLTFCGGTGSSGSSKESRSSQRPGMACLLYSGP